MNYRNSFQERHALPPVGAPLLCRQQGSCRHRWKRGDALPLHHKHGPTEGLAL